MIGQVASGEGGSIMGVESMRQRLISNLLGLVGAIAGGVLGFHTFQWLSGHGFYGLAIPGAFLGLGCGLLSRHNSVPRGAFCGVAALVLSLYSEWKFQTFVVDDSFLYMIANLWDKGPVTLVMIGLGTAIAFWVGKDGGFRGTSEFRQPPPAELKKGPVEDV